MYISQTLDRGLRILELIDGSTSPLGVREIARQTGLSATIVQRFVNTLAARGFVVQDPESLRYKIGHRSVSLGMSSQHGDTMTTTAHNSLAALAEAHGLNGFLGVLMGERAVYLLSVPSRHRIVLRLDAGETMPLHTTALGRVLLAAAGEERALELLGSVELPQITSNSITDPEKIVALLPEIRRVGYALVAEENMLGITSVGAPVRNINGDVVAGISVAYAINTLPLDTEEIVQLIVSAAEQVSRGLGCPDSLMQKWSIAP